MQQYGRDTSEEVTLGVVGSAEIVHDLMTVARESANPSWRLVAAVCNDEQEAHVQATKIVSRVDVLLFAGPLPYDLATQRADLPVPATYVPIGGSAFYATLLRGTLGGVFDPARVSIDSISGNDVRIAYREIGVDPGEVHVRQYLDPESVAGFVEFHRELYERGITTGAVTTVSTVAGALADAGVPSLKMAPTWMTLRHTLQMAALMGSRAKLEESRIVIIIVRVPRAAFSLHASPSNYWHQELKLSLHEDLLREARPLDAAVLGRDERSFMVVTMMRSLTMATNELTVAPFLGKVLPNLELQLEVGIGLGRSTREAELNAQAAVDRASAAGDNTAHLVGPGDTALQLPAAREGGGQPIPQPPLKDSKAVEVLTRLAAGLEREKDSEQIVDAEKVADLLDVTTRTARRFLHTLVDEGLAWPMPPPRSNNLGRPRKPYQLLVEKISR